MTLRTGTYTIGPGDGTLLVMTRREGAAAKMGHDLTLAAGRWSATVVVGVDPAQSSVTATIDAASLEVRDAVGGAIPITDKQRAEVAANIRDKVLAVSKHPEISFHSTLIAGDDASAVVTGELTIAGRTRPAQLELTVADDGEHVHGVATVAQTEYGIKPYSAMLGALKVRDRVHIEVNVRLSSPG